MKILIVSHYYKHKNAMASIRPIKLAKYFSSMGNDVTVLTSLQKDNWCKQELTPTPSTDICEIYAPAHKGMGYLLKVYDVLKKRGERKRRSDNAPGTSTKENQYSSKSTKNLKSKIKGFISWLFYYSSDRLENYFLARGLINAAKSNNLNGFDVVIATYPGAGVHSAGEWIKNKKRALHFIADYRDPAYNPGARNNSIELRHDKKVQDKAVKCADAVVCVSSGMAESLTQQYKESDLPPIFVVNNGFDLDDNKHSVPVNLDDKKFNFVYTGTLYQGRRTVDMLAIVLKKLIDNGMISANDIALNYAGPDFEELQIQLGKHGLEDIAVDYGYVSREQSLGMQQQSDIVLLLNWNDDNYTGVIPGKLYEYMSSKKPIVALIMGNKGNSETRRMIEEYGLGCACEQAIAGDPEKLKQYIHHKISEFKEGKRTEVNSKYIEMFEYRNIAKKYINIINQINKL